MKKIIFIFYLSLILLPLPVLAVTCPFGEVNEPAPGTCGRYVDYNDNNYCDLSETAPLAGQEISGAETAATDETRPTAKTDYHLGLITVILSLAYSASLLAVKLKKITVCANRRFWNWLLLILFLPTALTSASLALIAEFGYRLELGFDAVYWHYVFGWSFLVVSVFHCLWHTAYYFKKKSSA